MSSKEPSILWQGKYISVVRDGKWEYVRRNQISGIVGIVAVTDDKKLVLVEQHRPPLRRTVLELPAGLAGDTPEARGEALENAARRELLEETGYEARTMTCLGAGAASAGLSDEIITFFWARGLQRTGTGEGDGGEQITLHEPPLAQVHDWLAAQERRGAAVDLKIFAGLEMARRKGLEI